MGDDWDSKSWNAGLERLARRTVGLDGVVARRNNYRKSGFALAYRNVRFRGAATGNREQPPGIVSPAGIPFETLLDYDRRFFADHRKSFLQCWTSRKESKAFGVLHGAGFAGYGFIRPCRSGFKIGPLFADNADIAEDLFKTISGSVPAGSPIFLDISEINPEALQLTRRHGMNVVFETARMYKGEAPSLPVERIFGVTTFEPG